MLSQFDSLLAAAALEAGLLTEAQLSAGRAAQDREQPPIPLGVALIEAGLLDYGRVARLVLVRLGSPATDDPASAERVRAWQEAAIAWEREWITGEQAGHAMRVLEGRAAAGADAPRLADILREMGALAGPRATELDDALRLAPRAADTVSVPPHDGLPGRRAGRDCRRLPDRPRARG